MLVYTCDSLISVKGCVYFSSMKIFLITSILVLLTACSIESQLASNIETTMEIKKTDAVAKISKATPVLPTPLSRPAIPIPTKIPLTVTPILPTITTVPSTVTPASIVPPTFPTIVGTINFQVDIQQVTTASQLGQASIVGPDLIHLKDGRYRLYLQARADQRDKNAEGINILSLISNDAIEWNVEPGIRIKHGTQSDVDSEAGEPGVYLGQDDKYYMAYTGRYMGVNRRGAKQKMHRIVFAASEDGLTWLKLNKHYADPQNINDFASSANVNIVNGQYVIYYTGQRNIIRATSHDGLIWVRQEIAISTGHDSTMIKYDNTYYMFVMMPKTLSYTRNSDTKKDILMMVISDNGIDWPENYYQVIVKDSDGNEVNSQDLQDPGAIILSDGSLRIFLNNLGGKIIYSIKPTERLPKN